jgi:hypothetical protein
VPKQSLALALALFVTLGGCTLVPSIPSVQQPTPVVESPSPAFAWVENLVLAGQVTAQVSTVASDQTGQHSGCTATDSRAQGHWASQFYFLIGPDTWDLVVTVPHAYYGSGTYKGTDVSIQLADPTKTKVWESQSGDVVTFVVAANEQSGTIDAQLTNLTDLNGQVHISGSWTCSP